MSKLLFITLVLLLSCSDPIELKPIKVNEKTTIISFKETINNKYNIKLEEEYFDELDLNTKTTKTGVTFKVSNSYQKTQEDSILFLSKLSLDFLKGTEIDSNFQINIVKFFYEDSSYYLKADFSDLKIISNTIDISYEFLNCIFSNNLRKAYSLINEELSQVNQPLFHQEMKKFIKKNPDLKEMNLQGYNLTPSSSTNYDFDLLRVDIKLFLSKKPHIAHILLNPGQESNPQILGFSFREI